MNKLKTAFRACALANLMLLMGLVGEGAALAGQVPADDQDGVASMLVSTALDLFAGENLEDRPTQVYLHVFDDMPASAVTEDWRRLAGVLENRPESRWMLALLNVEIDGDKGSAWVVVYDYEAGGRVGEICAPFWVMEVAVRDGRWRVVGHHEENGWATTGFDEEGPYSTWWTANGGLGSRSPL